MSATSYTAPYRGRGTRARGNEQPRYSRPASQQMISQHGIPQPRAPTLNPGQASRTVLLQQSPSLFYQQPQQPQPLTASATGSTVVRAFQPQGGGVMPQIPQQVVLTPQHFGQTTLPTQIFNPQIQPFAPNPNQAINLQLQPTSQAPMAVHMPGNQVVPTGTTGIVANPPTTFNPSTQPKVNHQAQTTKRVSKALKIINPDTMTEVNVKESAESAKPTSSDVVAPVTVVTTNSSSSRPQVVLQAPTSVPAPARADVAQDFKQKVKSKLNTSSVEFVPGKPIGGNSGGIPPAESHFPSRPNAIIRNPNTTDVTAKVDPPLPEPKVAPLPIANGVESELDASVPITPLGDPPTDDEVDSGESGTKAQTEVPEVTPSVDQVVVENKAIEHSQNVSTEDKEPIRAEPPAETTPTDTTSELAEVVPSISKSDEPEVKVQPEPEVKLLPKPDVEVQPQPEVKVQPEPEMKVQPEPEVKVQPEPDIQVHPESEVEVQPEPNEMEREPTPPPVVEEDVVTKEEAVIEDEPVEDDSDKPKKYNREFLLKFAQTNSCKEPPAGLVKISDVYQRGGGQLLLSRPQVGGGGGPMPFDRDNRGKKGARRPSEPKRISHQPLQTEKVELHKAEQRWVRPQEALVELTEEEKQTTDLYRKFQGILNKLTPQKFQSLAEQALSLDINTEERLQGCIDKIFTKALEEPNFSIAYANLCKVLSPLKVDWEEQGKLRQTNFRRVLLTKCQTEFEKDKKDDEELEKMNLKIEEAEKPEDKKQLQSELDVFVTRARKRSLGNIRFIGELFKLQMLSETIMHECIVRLLKSTSDEESLECFARLITTTGKDLDQPKAKQRIDGYFQRMSDIIKKGKIPARIKFMLQDVQELRRNQWIPRLSQASTLKTIDQIHAEAKLAEEEDKRIVAQHQAAMSFTKGRGSIDDRRRGSKDEWQTKGEKERQPRDKPKLDRMRLAGLKKDKKDTATAVLGPPVLGRPGGWARNASSNAPPSSADKDKKPARSSSGGSNKRDKDRLPGGRGSGSGPKRGSHSSEQQAALEAVQKLTSGKPMRAQSLPVKPIPVPDALDEDTLRRKTCTIVDELVNNKDYKEALECVVELKSPGMANVFVSESINHSLEQKVEVRLAAGKLMFEMAKADLLSESKFMAGLNDVLEFADDIEVDTPKMWLYLGEILCPLFAQSTFALSLLYGVPSPLVESGKAAVLLANVLAQCVSTSSESEVASLWDDAKMDWNKLGVNSQDLAEFLTKQSLVFLRPPSSTTTTQQTPPYFTDMAATIASIDNTIDDVFDWVEKTCSPSIVKSPEFVQALAASIVQATVSGSGSSAIYNDDMFSKRALVLKKYVDEDISLQVQVLYALQVAVTKLEHPPKLLNQMFNELYNVEVIVEDAFIQWRDRGTESYGKGNCMQAVKTFFDWLEIASVESDDATGT